MPSNRWLKSVNPPEEKAKEEPAPNVSMREVRRLQQEKSANKEVTAEVENKTANTTPSTPSRGSTPPNLPTASSNAIAPERDFTKVANSIIREAVPAGVFAGKRKQLYDFLYSQTRGAVVPKRKVRMPKEKLMKGADIGAEVTLRQNLTHLKNAGLVIETVIPGKHGGNEYEVFLPEEIEEATPSRGSRPSNPLYPLYFLEGLEALVSRGSRGGLIVENTDTSAVDKTLYKTNTNTDDDEAFAGFLAAVKKTTKEVTGREPSKTEAQRWEEVAEVLMTELKIAAGRTTVSSVPAFLAEHLRRRLWKKEKRQIEAEAAEQKASSPAQKGDATKCPDCFGTGMYYPEGFDKGVARCPHSKLTTENAG
ncbi:MAG TPA: hypothetical protein VGX48_01975 [Pyrinomonadaceae bacterium]|jgi:hypothetical protein|nr:hypothetical protein [Pyrinomonadaceae bacterium]